VHLGLAGMGGLRDARDAALHHRPELVVALSKFRCRRLRRMGIAGSRVPPPP